MKKLNLSWKGQTISVYAQKIKRQLWFHYDGQVHIYEPEQKKTQGAAHGEKAEALVAPMPGKITKLSVREGELVEKGQTLVVMEAMKMEYRLEAPRMTRVKSVLCKEGEQVGLGVTLVRFQDEKGQDEKSQDKDKK